MRKFSIIVISFFMVQVLGFSQKIAVVDFRKIFESYKKTSDYDKILQEEQRKIKQEYKKRLEEIRKMRDSLEVLKKEEKEKKEKELQEKIKSLRKFERDKTLSLKKEFSDKMKEIRGDILKAISKYAEKKNIDFVLDKIAVLYQKSDADITQDIIEELNRSYKK